MARNSKQLATGTTLTLKYGTAEIVGFASPWRAEIYRPFEVHPSEPWNREIRERVMAVDAYDASTRHDKLNSYDSRCSCCYLNISHTTAKHDAAIGASSAVAS
jgi:hypothetical protein